MNVLPFYYYQYFSAGLSFYRALVLTVFIYGLRV